MYLQELKFHNQLSRKIFFISKLNFYNYLIFNYNLNNLLKQLLENILFDDKLKLKFFYHTI